MILAVISIKSRIKSFFRSVCRHIFHRRSVFICIAFGKETKLRIFASCIRSDNIPELRRFSSAYIGSDAINTKLNAHINKFFVIINQRLIQLSFVRVFPGVKHSDIFPAFRCFGFTFGISGPEVGPCIVKVNRHTAWQVYHYFYASFVAFINCIFCFFIDVSRVFRIIKIRVYRKII